MFSVFQLAGRERFCNSLPRHEGEARLMRGLGKGLVGGTDAGKATGVSREKAGHAARPVVDLEFGPIGLVGAAKSEF